MSISNKILLVLAIVGWSIAISLFFGRLQVNIITNQSQESSQSTIQATVNNNYLTETMVKAINTNYNITSQTNFSENSLEIVKDIIFGGED